MDSDLPGIVGTDALEALLDVAERVAERQQVLVTIKWDALRVSSADYPALWWTVVLYEPQTGWANRQDVPTLDAALSFLANRIELTDLPMLYPSPELCNLGRWESLCLTFGFCGSEVPGWNLDGQNADGQISKRLLGERHAWISTLG